MKNSEIVEGAIERIEKYGWRRWCMGGKDYGGYCLMGAGLAALLGIDNVEASNVEAFDVEALSEVVVWPTYTNQDCRMVADALAPGLWQHAPCEGIPIPDINDSIVDNKIHAITLLTTAAKYWRDRGE